MSTHLHQHLNDFLSPQQWGDLAFIAVARGPGGFTGTRIGVVTARTLAQQLNIPLVAISTLAACGWAAFRTELQASAQGGSGDFSTERAIAPPKPIDIAVEMKARRGDVYGAIYTPKPSVLPLSVEMMPHTSPKINLVPVMEESAMEETRWKQVLDTWKSPCTLVQGDGNLGWTAPYLLELAFQQWQQGDRPHWSEALPFYGQSPVS